MTRLIDADALNITTIVNIHTLPELMPDYEINKLWNSEDGKGISVLLKDNMEHYPIPKFVEDKTYTDMARRSDNA